MHSRWVGHQMTRMNLGNECNSTLPYQCNNRTIVSSSNNNYCHNHVYSNYTGVNGFNADDTATLRPGVHCACAAIAGITVVFVISKTKMRERDWLK